MNYLALISEVTQLRLVAQDHKPFASGKAAIRPNTTAPAATAAIYKPRPRHELMPLALGLAARQAAMAVRPTLGRLPCPTETQMESCSGLWSQPNA